MITSTIEIREIIWFLAAVPGLILWFMSYLQASKNLRAAVTLGLSNGRLLWAKFSRELTLLLTATELGFIVASSIAMTIPPSAASTPLLRWIQTSIYILIELAISFIAYRWRAVDNEILKLARRRNGPEQTTKSSQH